MLIVLGNPVSKIASLLQMAKLAVLVLVVVVAIVPQSHSLSKRLIIHYYIFFYYFKYYQFYMLVLLLKIRNTLSSFPYIHTYIHSFHSLIYSHLLFGTMKIKNEMRLIFAFIIIIIFLLTNTYRHFFALKSFHLQLEF